MDCGLADRIEETSARNHIPIQRLLRGGWSRAREFFRGYEGSISLPKSPELNWHSGTIMMEQNKAIFEYSACQTIKKELDIIGGSEIATEDRTGDENFRIDHDEPGRVGTDILGLLVEDGFAVNGIAEAFPFVLGFYNDPVDQGRWSSPGFVDTDLGNIEGPRRCPCRASDTRRSSARRRSAR